MHTMKLEKNVAFIREENKLIPSFKQETTIYTTIEKVPFYKRIFRRFLQQPCGAALVFAAIFLTYMKIL